MAREGRSAYNSRRMSRTPADVGTPAAPQSPLNPPPCSSVESAETVLRVEGLEKAYSGRWILRGVSLSVKSGERVALMGPSGSGKTTLLNCLGGVDRADRGSVQLLGENLESLDSAGLATLRRTRIGTVFQFFHLLPTLSAFENVELPLQLVGMPARERLERVNQLLARVQVDHRANARSSELSGGEQQRVAIARALAHRPRLLLADEPTGNLDSVNGAIVLELLRELSEETGTALVLVTHSPEATAICHRVIALHDGQIASEHAVGGRAP